MPDQTLTATRRTFVLVALAGIIWFLISDCGVFSAGQAKYLKPAADLLFMLGLIFGFYLVMRRNASKSAAAFAAREAPLLTQHVLEDEQRLRQILGQTRCIINYGAVTAEPGWRERAQREDWPFAWDYPVLNVETAQQVMPLAVPKDQTYYQAWKNSRNRQDEIQMHRNSGRAFLDGAPFYRNEFRCRDKDGIEHWMQQLVTINPAGEGRWQLFGVTVDISELKQAYQALGESEQQFRSCIEFLPVPIGIADDQGAVIYYNEMFTECFGYTRADTPTVDHWARQAFHHNAALGEKYLRAWRKDVEQARREDAPTRPRVYQLACKNGNLRQVEITTRPAGRLLISIFNDLTDGIQSEDQLRKLSRAVEQCPVSIFITDAQGRIEYVNPRFTELTGYQPREVLGKNPDASIELSSGRRLIERRGIYTADVVLIPLEDGDRCEKLVEMGKTVITIDLNPLSRTSRKATISIVDNLTRALDNMVKFAREIKQERKDELVKLIMTYDNKRVLSEAISEIQEHLKTIIAEIEY